MPIYEFKCSKCEEFFELLVMKTDDELELRCPKCKSEEFERVLSATSYAMGAGGKSVRGNIPDKNMFKRLMHHL